MSSDSIKELCWPPTYTLKKHARARYVKFKVSPQYGLEIVVPLRFNLKKLPGLLEKNKPWIEAQLLEMRLNRALKEPLILPEKIYFPVMNQVWTIHYIKSHHPKLQVAQRFPQELVLLGNIEEVEDIQEKLTTWVKSKANMYLPQLLKQVSDRTRLNYKSVKIRDQRTRWGSCTSEQAINLNYKLIFLRTELVQHILIHELCHTVHLNHSDQFWHLVASFDPEWKQHNKEMRTAERDIPTWIVSAKIKEQV